jgi:hypothetical protein
LLEKMGGLRGKEKKKRQNKTKPKKKGDENFFEKKNSCRCKSLPTMVGPIVVGAQ